MSEARAILLWRIPDFPDGASYLGEEEKPVIEDGDWLAAVPSEPYVDEGDMDGLVAGLFASSEVAMLGPCSAGLFGKEEQEHLYWLYLIKRCVETKEVRR